MTKKNEVYVTVEELNAVADRIIEETTVATKVNLNLDANKLVMLGLERIGLRAPWATYASCVAAGGATGSVLTMLIGM